MHVSSEAAMNSAVWNCIMCMVKVFTGSQTALLKFFRYTLSAMLYLLCCIRYTLSAMLYPLCFICYALSAMLYLLCFICYALSAMLYLLCFICFALSAFWNFLNYRTYVRTNGRTDKAVSWAAIAAKKVEKKTWM